MIVTAVLALGIAAAPADVDLLAQSRSGKLLCVNPDPATKTCSAISSFNAAADGSLVETTEVLLMPTQPLTLTMSIKAEMTGGTNCGVMQLDDLRRGQVKAGGQAIPADRNALVLAKLEASLGALAGKRVCEAVRIENNALVKYGQVDGVDIKLPGKPVMWVAKTDGYKVAPRN